MSRPPADLERDSAGLAARPDEVLIVDLEGYEGPLDVLLALARAQKVDLLKLSVTRLADQYLAFMRKLGQRRLVIAADYLLMAAWLAFLKSRLLLPSPRRDPAEREAPETAAANLAFRLAKLDAMRRAYHALQSAPLLGRDVFGRGDPTMVCVVSSAGLQGSLFELMQAYAGQRRRAARATYAPAPAQTYALDDARDRLRALLPELEGWTPLTGVAPMGGPSGPTRASYVASTLSASLEMVREGDLEARQAADFAEIFLRARKAAA